MNSLRSLPINRRLWLILAVSILMLVIQGAPAILPDAELGGPAGLSRQFKLGLQLLDDDITDERNRRFR